MALPREAWGQSSVRTGLRVSAGESGHPSKSQAEGGILVEPGARISECIN